MCAALQSLLIGRQGGQHGFLGVNVQWRAVLCREVAQTDFVQVQVVAAVSQEGGARKRHGVVGAEAAAGVCGVVPVAGKYSGPLRPQPEIRVAPAQAASNVPVRSSVKVD